MSAFQETRSDGAKWIPGAGGYVKNGKVVSTTPEYGGSSSGSSKSSSSGGSSGSSSSKSNSSSSYTPSYTEILNNYFKGDPQAYANEITNKGQGNLSHPDQAAAFMKAYPNLFQQSTQQPIQQPTQQPYQQTQQQTAPDYSYLIPLVPWFAGKDISNKDGTLNVGGFSFAPGSYETQGDNYYVDPMTMAGSYLNRAPRELTPDVYDNYVDQATEYYEPTHQARINALNDILAERKGATRRTAIGGGTYTSGNYLDRLNEEVEKPYAEGMVDLETNLSALVNQMAMQEFEKERAAEQAQNQNVANYLMNLSATGRDEAWKRALQSIMLAQGQLGGAY